MKTLLSNYKLYKNPQPEIGFEVLLEELSWLASVLTEQLKRNLNLKIASLHSDVPELGQTDDPYSKFVIDNKLNSRQRLLLILALTPHIRPNFFDEIIQNSLGKSGDFPEIGGLRGKNFRGFLPTGETALFLLGGNDLESRFQVKKMFGPDDFFAKNQVLWLEDPPSGEPLMSGKIIMSHEYIDLITTGKISKPKFGTNFPAQPITTKMNWNDLVLPQETVSQIKDLENWLQHGDTLLKDWGMDRKLNPGYRVLFHGPPGTGKTLTASLLGKYTGREVYKIDLSMVVSKFIGETEKNLANLFDKAENKDWILFFDEADALFGKRTNVRDAHDKYANQEVSFLLQRTENYSGLVILATNFKNNIDDAFARRFQSHIYFPIPKYAERYQLWQQAFPENIQFEEQTDLSTIARQYELTGAHIMNIVQYACLQSLSKETRKISQKDLLEGIKKEYSKEGKTI